MGGSQIDTVAMRLDLPETYDIFGDHVDMNEKDLKSVTHNIVKIIAELELKKVEIEALTEEFTNDQLIQTHGNNMIVHDRELFLKQQEAITSGPSVVLGHIPGPDYVINVQCPTNTGIVGRFFRFLAAPISYIFLGKFKI